MLGGKLNFGADVDQSTLSVRYRRNWPENRRMLFTTLAMQRFSQGRGTNLNSGARWSWCPSVVQPARPAQVSQTGGLSNSDFLYQIRSLRLSLRLLIVQSFEAFEFCTESAVPGMPGQPGRRSGSILEQTARSRQWMGDPTWVTWQD